MTDTPPGFDILKRLERHHFHYSDDRTCHFCKVDKLRRENTPEAMWAKSLMRVIRPPAPVAIMAGAIAVLIIALAFSLQA